MHRIARQKLTAASNAGGARRTSGRSLLDRHVRSLDDRLSDVSIVHGAREPSTVCAIHKTTEAWRCSPSFSGRVYDTKRPRYPADKLCKKYHFEPNLETRGQSPTIVQFSRRSARYICPLKKYIFSL